MQAIDRDETREYVKAQIEWAGGQPDRLFTAEALDAVYQATQGIPRLINQVCDHALLLSCAAGDPSLDKSSGRGGLGGLAAVANAVEPSIGRDDAEPQAGSVIEFGVLSDEDDGDRRSLAMLTRGNLS